MGSSLVRVAHLSPPGPIYSTPGGHIGLCGALPATWHDIQMPSEAGPRQFLIRGAHRFPCCICAQQLRPSAGTVERAEGKGHRETPVMKQWRSANKKYWPYYFQEPKFFLFVCLFLLFNLNICHSTVLQRQLVARIFSMTRNICPILNIAS